MRFQPTRSTPGILLVTALITSGCGGGGGGPPSGGNPPSPTPPAVTAPSVRVLVAYEQTPSDPALSYVRVALTDPSAPLHRPLYYERFGATSHGNCPSTAVGEEHGFSTSGRWFFRERCGMHELEEIDLLAASPSPVAITLGQYGIFDHSFTPNGDSAVSVALDSTDPLAPNWGGGAAFATFDANTGVRSRTIGVGVFGNSLYWWRSLRAIPGTPNYFFVGSTQNQYEGAYYLDTTTQYGDYRRFTVLGSDLTPFDSGIFSANGRYLRAAQPRALPSGDFEIPGYDLSASGQEEVLYTLRTPAGQTLERVLSFGDASLLFVLSSTAPDRVHLVAARIDDDSTKVIASYPRYSRTPLSSGFVRGNEYLDVADATGDRAEVFAYDLTGTQPPRLLTPAGGVAGISAIATLGSNGILITHEGGQRLGFIREATPGVVNPISSQLAAGNGYSGALADAAGNFVAYARTTNGRAEGPAYVVELRVPDREFTLPGQQANEAAVVRGVLGTP